MIKEKQKRNEFTIFESDKNCVITQNSWGWIKR